MRYYVALIHKDAESDFGVSFPDFPGCISAGSTLSEAAAMGAEALAGHIDLMSDEGLPVPEPSTLETVMADPGNRDGVPVMVPAAVRKPVRAVRANITVPEDILAKIDAFAESQGMSRSGFLTHAATREIQTAAEHVGQFANIVAWNRPHPLSQGEEGEQHDAIRSVGKRMASLAESMKGRAVEYTEFEALFRELHTLGSMLPNSVVQAVANAFVAEERKHG